MPFPEPLVTGNIATWLMAAFGLVMVGSTVLQFWQHRKNPLLWWAAAMVCLCVHALAHASLHIHTRAHTQQAHRKHTPSKHQSTHAHARTHNTLAAVFTNVPFIHRFECEIITG